MPTPNPTARFVRPLPAAAVGPAPAASAPVEPGTRFLRLLVALYIALWIFEGVLRKWVVPGLANPLLVIRDPVLLLLYALALPKGIFPFRPLVIWMIGLAAMTFAISIVGSNVPLIIQLYGLRADYLHLPLIFLMANLYDRDDVRQVGKWILLLGAPMALLVALQFLSPAASFLNRGAGGGEAGGQLESAYGHIRPSGTYSFTNGLSGFTSLLGAFFLHHLLERRVYSKWLWLAAGPSLVVLITLSGSRAAVGLAGLIMASVLFICLLKPRYWQPALKLVVVGFLATIILGSFAIFQSGLQVFAYRFGDSDNVRAGFFGRFADTLTAPYAMLKDIPAGGVGLGMGTNVAGALMTGKRTFLIAEGEWPRVLLESGAFAGSAFIILRGAIVVCLGLAAVGSLRRSGNTLPLLIFAGCFVDILQGQFAQPTALGFAVVAGGLCLAACRVPAAAEVSVPLETAPVPTRARGTGRSALGSAEPPAPPAAIDSAAAPGRRGRSIYAERLHQAGEEMPGDQ